MGYKLAGYNHLGGVELDAAVASCYERNLHPKYLYVEDLRAFNKRDDLPEELYQLDLLDGSPPCTLFSINRGQRRENSWGKALHFKEGQATQTLDDLPFVWCDTVAKLRPKICLMENVEGMVKGNAIKYLYAVLERLHDIGYKATPYVLDAQFMGVPQVRRRLFVIAHRKEYDLPALDLHFREKPILFGEVMDKDFREGDLGGVTRERWMKRKHTDNSMSDIAKRTEGKESDFGTSLLHYNKVHPTVTTTKSVLYEYPRHITNQELFKVSTFPQDYDFSGASVTHLTGMCVPPVMTAQIAYRIRTQWLEILHKTQTTMHKTQITP